MAKHDKWTKSEIDTLVAMWNADRPSKEIAEALNRKRSTISMFVSRHAKELGIKQRMHLCYGGRPKSTKLVPFEKQWAGPVSFGHWMITKPWSQKNGQAS